VELEDIAVRLKQTIQNLRQTVNEMRPPALIRFGLAKALNVYLGEFREQHPQIKLDSSLSAEEGCLSEPTRIGLYQIVHEALTNAIKHAKANQITVALSCNDHHITLEIQDDGDGFTIYENLVEYSLQGHYGLVGMKERAEAIGGSLEIATLPGQGTTIRVVVPQEP
jgi:two-component system sensor histidine kinase DegS